MHSIPMGYLFWLFGFMGAHRFYYGKPVSGTLYFFTLGLAGIGWFVDAFLIPGMERQAKRRFRAGERGHNVAWVLLTFLGVLGIHRFYMGKWATGPLWPLTGGLGFMGVLCDFWTFNDQLDQRQLPGHSSQGPNRSGWS